jgi:hypothetical protein
MIKRFAINIEIGRDDDDLIRRMKVMAGDKKSEALKDSYGIRPKTGQALPEIVSLPRKLRTTVEWILEYIQLDTEGLGKGMVEVRYPVPYGVATPGEAMSRSEVFCPFCYGMGEPDSAEFFGGVCVDCERSVADDEMQVGYWKQKSRNIAGYH